MGVAGKAQAPHRKYGPLSCSELWGAPRGSSSSAVGPAEPRARASRAVLVQVRGPGRRGRDWGGGQAVPSACTPGPRRTCPQIRFLLSHYHRNRSFRPHSSPRYYLTRIIN